MLLLDCFVDVEYTDVESTALWSSLEEGVDVDSGVGSEDDSVVGQ